MTQEANLNLFQITGLEQLSRAFDAGLISLYQGVWATSSVYGEHFSEDDVKTKFAQYVTKGLLFLFCLDQEVVGFGAAVPFRESEIAHLAVKLGIRDPDKTWYMADLGVKENVRLSGLGMQLIQVRLDKFEPGTEVVMRTAVANEASQKMYSSLGFKRLPHIQYVSQPRVPKKPGEPPKEEADPRIFMYRIM